MIIIVSGKTTGVQLFGEEILRSPVGFITKPASEISINIFNIG